MDSIEYELTNWEAREVWHCKSCKRYRHRKTVKGLLPALCCGKPAILVTRYEQPIAVVISEPILPAAAQSLVSS